MRSVVVLLGVMLIAGGAEPLHGQRTPAADPATISLQRDFDALNTRLNRLEGASFSREVETAVAQAVAPLTSLMTSLEVEMTQLRADLALLTDTPASALPPGIEEDGADLVLSRSGSAIRIGPSGIRLESSGAVEVTAQGEASFRASGPLTLHGATNTTIEGGSVLVQSLAGTVITSNARIDGTAGSGVRFTAGGALQMESNQSAFLSATGDLSMTSGTQSLFDSSGNMELRSGGDLLIEGAGSGTLSTSGAMNIFGSLIVFNNGTRQVAGVGNPVVRPNLLAPEVVGAGLLPTTVLVP
jgi:hypothetical protein